MTKAMAHLSRELNRMADELEQGEELNSFDLRALARIAEEQQHMQDEGIA